jgi:hypothetical protein
MKNLSNSHIFPSPKSRTVRSKSLSFIDGHTSRNSSHSFGNDYVELQTIDTDLSEFSTSQNSSLTDVSFTTSPGSSYNKMNAISTESRLPPPHESLSEDFSEPECERREICERSEICENSDPVVTNNTDTFPPPDPSLFDSGIAETPTNHSSLNVSSSENEDASKTKSASSSTANYKSRCPSETKISDSSETFFTSSESSLENKENGKVDKFYKIYFEDGVRKKEGGSLSRGKFYLRG